MVGSLESVNQNFSILCLCAILPLTASAVEQSRVIPGRDQQPVVHSLASPQTADRPPRVSPDVRWRYRFHNGHWWYWREDGSWAYWSGAEWYKYAPQSYRRWYLAWRLAQDEAEVARLNALMRSYRARSSGRTWVEDPSSFLPFANQRGGDR